MKQLQYKDCYASFDGTTLIIGNAAIEKAVEIAGGYPLTRRVINRTSGYVWEGDTALCLPCSPVDLPSAQVHAELQIVQSALSTDALCAHLSFDDGQSSFTLTLRVFPTLPFVSSVGTVSRHADTTPSSRENAVPADVTLADRDAVEALALPDGHYKLTAYDLFDKTDHNDEPVVTRQRHVYKNGKTEEQGSIFVLDNYTAGESLLLVKNAPTHSSALHRSGPDLCLHGTRALELRGTGVDFDCLPDGKTVLYGATVGVGQQDMLRALRALGRAENNGGNTKHLFIMSNNWGDRNLDLAMSEAFALAEIDRAAELGVTLVQLDDGWQKGASAESGLSGMNHPWEGYHTVAADFWTVHPDKFPRGLSPVMAHAKNRGVEIALWFSPDSSDDFACWEKDVAVLWALYREHGIRRFKMDGITVRSKRGEANLIRILTVLTEKSDGDITFNLDVTASDRFGYLYQPQFGTLFVENRYTDWANYYPHNTLKNLWQLSHILPARRMQFEFLNHRRNQDKYAGDPLAPAHYGMDYLFAVTMMANPLVWMEMASLHAEDAALLKKVIAAYRPHEKALFDADVRPVGACPDGISHTGFHAVCSPEEGYLLLFRELTADTTGVYTLAGLENKTLALDLIYTNTPHGFHTDGQTDARGMLSVCFDTARSFAFWHYRVK